MPSRRILVLGGTGEARVLAQMLLDAGFETVTSLAGVTHAPLLPPGEMRRGGFGGASGLIAFVARESIAAIVDATHPFAAQMSHHAFLAAEASGIACLRLERPAWVAEEGDRWIDAPDVLAAAACLPHGTRAMVTVGRKEIGAFFARDDLSGIARMIESPAIAVPAAWTLILERPPYTADGERELMQHHRIGMLVTKNAGGDQTRAKLLAAREIKIPVVMIARPLKPVVPSFGMPERVADALREMLSP